jgi:uncharacterized ubiquitin-like protein YukD
MAYVAVTLEYARNTMDVALPMHVPSRLLVDGLVDALKITKVSGRDYFLGVKSEQGLRHISSNASLGDVFILHGMTLALMEDEQKGAPTVETGASLRAENGTVFPLTSKVTLIGRNDSKSGIFVEIDLTAYIADPKIISRKHAQIEQEGDRFYVVDLGSVNGTKLNGQRLTPREKKPVWEGDVLEFGKNGVQLVLQGGKEKE